MKIIECPRDAMQGIKAMIPTNLKAEYINSLLKVGFDTIDFGSFVSPKAVPQMSDTAEVIRKLDLSDNKSKLLAIIANRRGAEDACNFEEIQYLGFPLSISESFQIRNTNKTIEEALVSVEEINKLAVRFNKTLVVYLSMGFGNPYGDPYDKNVLTEFVEKLKKIGIKIVSIADTIGVSEPKQIGEIFPSLIKSFPEIEFGAHLHSLSQTSIAKVKAVIETGCKRMDGALLGFGGCPMAKDDLTGNIDTLNIISEAENQISIDKQALSHSLEIANRVFSKYK
jgi:hydroxymethylglutaryl-CoA lyase